MNDSRKAGDTLEALDVLGITEVLDEQGNPTGIYISEGQAASTEAEVFIAEDAPSHEVRAV